MGDCDGLEDEDAALDAMLRRKLDKEQCALLTPSEQIVQVAFILDRVPSYILVISKIFAGEVCDQESMAEVA